MALSGRQLTTVQGEMKLANGTAAAWFAFESALRAATSIDPIISAPGGAWRSEAMVLDMWRNPEKYGATQGTARPRSLGGPGSVHESGRCVDIKNHSQLRKAIGGQKELAALAARFGFTFSIGTELWHVQHDGVTGGGAGSGYPSETGEGDDMAIVVENKDAKIRVWSVFDPAFVGTTVGERGYLETTDHARARAWVLRYMPAADGAYQWSAENYKAGQVESRLLHEAWQRGGASGGSSGVTAAEIRAILEPLFAGVNANIDDQPTTFKVTPS